MNRPIRLRLLALALATGVGSAHAYTYVMPTDRALAAQAESIVTARVESVTPVMSGDGRYARGARYGLRIVESFAGKRVSGAQTLYLPGTPDVKLGGPWIPGVPVLAPGDEVLLFAARGANGDLVPVQLSLGLFIRDRGKHGDLYVRGLGDAYNLDKTTNALYELPRDAGKFEAALRAGVGAKPDYFALDEDVDAKFTHLRGGDNVPVRWFEFDSSTNVSWRAVAGGQASTTFDEFASVQQALTAWTNDPGSKITVSYGGTVASDMGNNGTDGVNAVIWNDPGNDITGSFSCSSGGTLAIGGPFFSGATTISNGLGYHDAVEGFVIVQDGAGCALDGHSGADGAETLGHEIGHALGLGHSCGDGSSGSCGAAGSAVNQAIMRASIHGDGRGAQLGDDDRLGMAFIYPDASGVNVIFANGFE